jgi:OmpA-OmpF porin, OOP family
LSERRADAVGDYLVRAGIPSSQLIPHGYGKTNFVAPNDTPEGRAQNRRVELVPND